MKLRLWCEHAWLGGRSATDGVLVVIDGERIESVEPGVTQPPTDSVVLRGVTFPGFVNVHINSLDRVTRGAPAAETARLGYALNTVADLDAMRAVAEAVLCEQSLAGYTTIGHVVELRRQIDGSSFESAGALHERLVDAAQQVGIRLAVIDVCATNGHPRTTHQAVHEWVDRIDPWFDAQPSSSHFRLIGGIGDQRGLGSRGLADIALWSGQCGLSVHARLGSATDIPDGQNRSSAALDSLIAAAVPTNRGGFTAVGVQGTTVESLQYLGHNRAFVAYCASTDTSQFNLAALRMAGGRVVSYQSAAHIPNPFEAMRALRRCSERQPGGTLGAPELLRALTSDGAASLGWRDAGLLASGQLADLVSVDLSATRLVGCYGDDLLERVVSFGEPADITHVAVGGQLIVDRSRHRAGDVSAKLHQSVSGLAQTAGHELMRVAVSR
jgi:cytosine/adenosine deaminase-related metal-dependent hydrolase